MQNNFENIITNQITKRKTKEYFYKIYPKSALIGDIIEIEIRLNFIKHLSEYYFDFEWSNSELILKSKLIIGRHQNLNYHHFTILARYLDNIHSKNLFHGDIHNRNIIVENDIPYLVDWEPCMVQNINSKRIIKSHSRGIAKKDRNNKKISALTDKKGFLNLLSNLNSEKLIDTKEMENLSCFQLLNKCYQSSP